MASFFSCRAKMRNGRKSIGDNVLCVRELRKAMVYFRMRGAKYWNEKAKIKREKTQQKEVESCWKKWDNIRIDIPKCIAMEGVEEGTARRNVSATPRPWRTSKARTSYVFGSIWEYIFRENCRVSGFCLFAPPSPPLSRQLATLCMYESHSTRWLTRIISADS